MRIKHYKECEALQYGTASKFSGCLMQIKAKLAGAKCPLSYAPRR